VDAVGIALAACSGQDVVSMLEKRRTPVQKMEIDVRYARVDGTPRRLAAFHIVFRVHTTSAPHHVERAASLAVEKYCSVASSLAPDVKITTAVEVIAP
jgi:putative redox protein